jgi:hypothetical protein
MHILQRCTRTVASTHLCARCFVHWPRTVRTRDLAALSRSTALGVRLQSPVSSSQACSQPVIIAILLANSKATVHIHITSNGQ